MLFKGKGNLLYQASPLVKSLFTSISMNRFFSFFLQNGNRSTSVQFIVRSGKCEFASCHPSTGSCYDNQAVEMSSSYCIFKMIKAKISSKVKIGKIIGRKKSQRAAANRRPDVRIGGPAVKGGGSRRYGRFRPSIRRLYAFP